ncbi:phage head spike fiber domain-containing protein [Aeromonas dhakensis]|uniref:phage head spike fiber domain-containing protein n=1 Tax=Aeromonas dhakensis TaxID=196024 RepID=UPI0035711029
MAGLWYRVGTVTLTNGSKVVVGYGTKWKSANPLPGKGSMLCGPDGKVYEVDTVADDNNLTLVSNYTGTSGAGQGYALVLMALTIPQFSTQLSQFVQKNSLFASQINTLLTATGDVNLTDPDSGLVIKLPSWSKIASDGEGQAARAKVEADRSKTEADRSGDNADRAAGIVAAAALPLPDVWAPLTDSLRLFTGYGREVKVGDDVIARMLTFSRSTTKTYTNRDGVLTTAAVNEPTFDQWGIQLDGQISNLISTSTSFKNASAGVSYEAVSNPSFPHAITRVIKPTGSGDVWTNNAELIVGTVYTASIYIDKSVLNPQAGVYYGANSIAASMVRSGVVVGGLERYTATFTCQASGTHQIRFGAYGGTFDFVAGCPQIEALQFASTYQPTTGAVTTRSADILTLQNPLNIPVGAGDMTVAFEVRRNPLMPTSSFPRIFHIGTHTWLVGDSVRFAMRGGTADQGQALKNAPGTMETVVYRIKGDQITVRCGSTVATVTRTGAITANNMVTNIGSDSTGVQNLFGHVRNLRVWRRALTDDQMKAIA